MEATLAKARELTAAISLSVCDAYWHLVAHQRMDNVLMDAIRESIGKGVAAAESGSPSGGTLRENAYYPLTGMVVATFPTFEAAPACQSFAAAN